MLERVFTCSNSLRVLKLHFAFMLCSADDCMVSVCSDSRLGFLAMCMHCSHLIKTC